MQILDAHTSTQLAQERHVQLARDYAATAVRHASAQRRSRRRRLFTVLRPGAA